MEPENAQASMSLQTCLNVKTRRDTRSQPWQKFMEITHTADKPLKIGSNVRLLGQRVNAHVG